jgi:hypothetical protein
MTDTMVLVGVAAVLLAILYVTLYGNPFTTTPVVEGFASQEVYEYIYDPRGVYIGRRLKSK